MEKSYKIRTRKSKSLVNKGLSPYLVETTGIEPVSKNPFIRPSPWAVYLFKLPFVAADKQAAPQGIPFLLDRFKREPPMQVHCSNDAQTKVAVILGGTGGYKETAALPKQFKPEGLNYFRQP